jgi:hypothetical protein
MILRTSGKKCMQSDISCHVCFSRIKMGEEYKHFASFYSTHIVQRWQVEVTSKASRLKLQPRRRLWPRQGLMRRERLASARTYADGAAGLGCFCLTGF